MQRVRVELSSIGPGLEVQVLLSLERVAVTHQQQQIICLHARNLFSRHELLTLFRVGKIPTLVRGLTLSNLLRIDSAFPEVARCPFGGFDIVEVEDAFGDAGTEDRTGIVWPIGLFYLTSILGNEQRFPYAKAYRVFNADQIEGLPGEFYILPDPPRDLGTVADPELEAFFAASGAQIDSTEEPRAYYNIKTDRIHMPPITTFHRAAGYYGTLAHELTHWTGATNHQFQGRAFPIRPGRVV